MPQGEQELENSFIELQEGELPVGEDDLVVDTLVMEELGTSLSGGPEGDSGVFSSG